MSSLRILLLTLVTVSTLWSQETTPTTFDVKVEGQGIPIILIPGLSCSGEIWQSTIDHLKDKFQCHIISIKGFGGTPAMTTLPSPFLKTVRDEIIAYIRARKLGKPVVIGHSLGGLLTLEIGAAAPELVRGLVVIDASPFAAAQINPDVTQETVNAIASTIRKQGEKASPESFAATSGHIVETMINSSEEAKAVTVMVNQSDQKTVMEAAAELFTTDLRKDIAKITCPMVVISALGDKAAFGKLEDYQSRMRQQFASTPQVEIVFIPDSRHFVMFDQPRKFFEIIDAALARP